MMFSLTWVLFSPAQNELVWLVQGYLRAQQGRAQLCCLLFLWGFIWEASLAHRQG